MYRRNLQKIKITRSSFAGSKKARTTVTICQFEDSPLTAKLFNLNFQIVSRLRDPQLQVRENI